MRCETLRFQQIFCESLRVNNQVNLLSQRIRYLADNVSTEKIKQRVAFGGAEDEAWGAERRGDIDDRFRGGETNRVLNIGMTIVSFGDGRVSPMKKRLSDFYAQRTANEDVQAVAYSLELEQSRPQVNVVLVGYLC
jgi:hypothetical protein